MTKIRHISLALIMLVLYSCSAERRLANLLYHHPELKQDSVLIIDTFLTTQHQTDTTSFTLEDLKEIIPSASGDSDTISSAENVTQSGKSNAPISAQTDHCKALITANADGSFNLIAEQEPDTIYIHDTITVTKYYTDTKYEDKIVHQMNPIQKLFFWLGIISSAILFGIILAKILERKRKL